jgi:hypothetical protein
MSDVAHVASLVKENHPATVEESSPRGRQLWGSIEIGRAINRTPRQAYHLLNSGAIKSARKVGGRWTANETTLRREFGG